MHKSFFATPIQSLQKDKKTYKKLQINHQRNRSQDHTEAIDAAAASFCYEDCRDQYWNPSEFSLLYGTPLWEQATADQRLILNHLFWVAYYSQIISAEIATIYLNQCAAAGMYSIEDFRLVCDNLDLESAQERAHINAFKTVSEEVEFKLFGKRIFTYPMRPYFVETMIFQRTNAIKRWWKSLQLKAFSLLSSGNAFLGCQYFTIRGIRTLNGKLVQHRLAQFHRQNPETSPLPAKISFFHFMDESYHFNSSTIISQDVVHSLAKPTAFEKALVNTAIHGCQKDHYHFSAAINGIFWYDPALFQALAKVFQSQIFGMEKREAEQMIFRCFAKEHEGYHQAAKTHTLARESYMAYVEKMEFVSKANKSMLHMGKNTLPSQLRCNQVALRGWKLD